MKILIFQEDQQLDVFGSGRNGGIGSILHQIDIGSHEHHHHQQHDDDDDDEDDHNCDYGWVQYACWGKYILDFCSS